MYRLQLESFPLVMHVLLLEILIAHLPRPDYNQSLTQIGFNCVLQNIEPLINQWYPRRKDTLIILRPPKEFHWKLKAHIRTSRINICISIFV